MKLLKKLSHKTQKAPERKSQGSWFFLSCYAKSFITPMAAAISPMGISRRKPPARIRQTMNIGTAKTRSIVATIFASPQVILNVRLIAFMSKTTAKIEIIISVILISPFVVIFLFRYYAFFVEQILLSFIADILCVGDIPDTPFFSLIQ